MNTLSVGDRVEKTEGETLIVGVVKSIQLVSTRSGFAPQLQVQVGEGVEVVSSANEWRLHGTAESHETDACPDCGEVHSDGPVTPAVVELYQRYNSATDCIERRSLLVELAEEFAGEVDPTETDTPEWVHEMVSQAYETARKLEESWFKLGRAVVHILGHSAQSASLRSSIIDSIKQATNRNQGGFDN